MARKKKSTTTPKEMQKSTKRKSSQPSITQSISSIDTEQGTSELTPSLTSKIGEIMSAKAAQGKQDLVRQQHDEEMLLCQLTAEELETIADRSAHIQGQIESKDLTLKAMQSTLSSEIKTLRSQLSELAKKRRDKCELRKVSVTDNFVYKTNEVRRTRDDTEEIVRTRALTRDERQEELAVDGQSFKSITKGIPVENNDEFEDDDFVPMGNIEGITAPNAEKPF